MPLVKIFKNNFLLHLLDKLSKKFNSQNTSCRRAQVWRARVQGKCGRLSQYLPIYEHTHLTSLECLTVLLITLFRVTGQVRMAARNACSRRECERNVPMAGVVGLNRTFHHTATQTEN